MLCSKSSLICLLAVVASLCPSLSAADDDVWSSIKKDILGDVEVEEGGEHLSIDAPNKADDAAVVPVTVTIPSERMADIEQLILVIDKNPSPVAAVVNYGPAAGKSGQHLFATRVRMDTQSPIRAIVRTADGRYFMKSKVVNAAGGCSSSGSKDSDAKSAEGEARIKVFAPAPGSAWLPEAQIMLRHPNYSGMQRDHATGELIPARFVDKLKVSAAGRTVFEMTGGISISENPNLRFTFAASPGIQLDMEASDTEGRHYKAAYRY